MLGTPARANEMNLLEGIYIPQGLSAGNFERSSEKLLCFPANGKARPARSRVTSYKVINGFGGL